MLDGDHFEISQRFHLMLNEYDVRRSDGAAIARVRQKRMALRERIDLWADDAQTQLFCSVQARSVVDVRATYDVTDGAGTRIGTLRKQGLRSLLSSTWEVRDAADQPVAVVSEASTAIAVIRRIKGFLDVIPIVGWVLAFIPVPFGFTFRAPDGRVIGEHKRRFTVRDHYDLRLERDPEQRLDRRVAIALAICLDALQSR